MSCKAASPPLGWSWSLSESHHRKWNVSSESWVRVKSSNLWFSSWHTGWWPPTDMGSKNATCIYYFVLEKKVFVRVNKDLEVGSWTGFSVVPIGHHLQEGGREPQCTRAVKVGLRFAGGLTPEVGTEIDHMSPRAPEGTTAALLLDREPGICFQNCVFIAVVCPFCGTYHCCCRSLIQPLAGASE